MVEAYKWLSLSEIMNTMHLTFLHDYMKEKWNMLSADADV